jgi:hypothetical protein
LCLTLDFSNPSYFGLNNNSFCPPFPSCIADYMGEQECDYQLIDGKLYFTDNLKFLKDLIANSGLNVKPLDLGYQTWQDGKLTF